MSVSRRPHCCSATTRLESALRSAAIGGGAPDEDPEMKPYNIGEIR